MHYRGFANLDITSGDGPSLKRTTPLRLPSSPQSPPEGRGADLRRPLYDDGTGALQTLHKPLGHDLRHDLVGVVDAVAALEAQGEGERVGDIFSACGG